MKTVGETLRQNMLLSGISKCVSGLPQSRQFNMCPRLQGKEGMRKGPLGTVL